SLIADPSGSGVHGGGVGFLGTGNRIAVGWGSGKLAIHDTATGDKLREFVAHRDGITAMAISPDSRVIATGAGFTERTIKLWNPDSDQMVRELTNHQAWICSLAFSPDGALLASSSADQTIRLWDTKTWAEITTLRGHEDEVYSLAFSADGRRIITGGKDGSVRLWPIPPAKRPSPRWILSEPCNDFAMSPDGGRLVTSGDDYVLWNLDTGEKLATLTELRGYSGGCTFSPNGRQLLVGGRAGKIRIWDFERSSLSEFDAGHDEDIAGVETLGTTNFVLAAWWGRGTRWKIWNFEKRQLVREFEWSGPLISEGNFSRRADLALGQDDGGVTILTAESGWAQTHFAAHRRAVSGIAFAPDGRILATGGVEGTAKLWDVATQREIVTLKGHLKSVHAVDISPDGNRLATAAGGAESVKLWDMHTHQELITIAGEGAIMVALVFSPDGNKIIGWNDQRHLQIWRAPSWEEIKTAEAQDKKELKTP
ncbi:MAG TPA: WD40 repeat domain-containing protein, partial [Verrucomicrobiae bacterium]|nr:WD40 repeat domain-containing protein [Verrucomicrobiae bacterium]